MKFSICIPNYNYATYIDRTISSVLEQSAPVDFEVCVSDNASTDESMDVITSFDDDRLIVARNRTNLGFAANLDCAVRLARGEIVMLLSSDDLMLPGTLDTYATVFDHYGWSSTVLSSAAQVIDHEGQVIGRTAAQPTTWKLGDRDDRASSLLHADLYTAQARDILGRSLATMRSPFKFLSTAYPRFTWEEVGGYGHRLINPDKWFAWKALAAVDRAVFVNEDLFQYRWHAGNQTAQQASEAALKFHVDEYASTLQVTEEMLAAAKVDRQAVIAAFVRVDVGQRGLLALAEHDGKLARRILHFGKATYPKRVRRDLGCRAVGVLLTLGPLGESVARLLVRNLVPRWRDRQSGGKRHSLHDVWASELRG